ncbi:MAG: hypothetical protein R3D62_08350 [Xanthobacteraceae bacterium]
MIEDEDCAAGPRARPEGGLPPAANDNGNGAASGHIDAAVLTIARLIGRQMAREAFERLKAANDNDSAERRED